MEKWGKVVLGSCFVCLVASIVILTMVPPVSKDALAHHLFVPKLYLNHGGIYEIPWLQCSYYPMNLDLLYTAVLYFGNDIAPKFFHFAFALGTCWVIFGYLRNRLNILYGMLGALFFLSIPIVIKLSITVYVDLGLVFFSAACLIYLFKWMENSFSKRYLIISAVFCGLALGTKYNGLITCLIVCLFIPFVYLRQKNEKAADCFKALGFCVLFLGVALLLFSPWMIKNFHWTKNPVYPLYNSVFKSFSNDYLSSSVDVGVEDKKIFFEVASKTKRESPFATRRILFGENLWDLMTIPVRIFFQGKDDTGKYFDGKLSPFLFVLPFFAFWPQRKKVPLVASEKKILLWFSVLFLLIVLFTADMRIRYVAPIIPPLVILSVFGLSNLEIFLSRRPVFGLQQGGSLVFIALVVFLMLSMHATYIYKQFRIVNPIGYLSGEISRDEYIEHFRPGYPVIQYANNNLSDDAKIFTIYLGNRGYYFDKEILIGRHEVVSNLIDQADSAIKLAEIFK
jgi:4-amino-4-deoxy-L-arabinose transferase-like glycosyltransferase